MGFGKLGFFILALLFFQLLLLPTLSISHENPQLAVADIDYQKNELQQRQEELIANRRGGRGQGGSVGHIVSGGGHGIGGESEGHGNGDRSPNPQGGALIPLYGSHHRDDHHHHGSNIASRSHNYPSYLIFSILMPFAFLPLR